MENPFESGHIKNYLLLYASIVVIMVLFFIASTLFHEAENIDKKSFNTEITDISNAEKSFNINIDENRTNKFKLFQGEYNY